MTRVPVEVTLQIADGRQFVCHEDVDAQYADSQLFWWTEGNGGCDCNRSLSLNREYGLALGTREDPYEDPYDVPCLPCGETIRLVRLCVDGREVFAGETPEDPA